MKVETFGTIYLKMGLAYHPGISRVVLILNTQSQSASSISANDLTFALKGRRKQGAGGHFLPHILAKLEANPVPSKGLLSKPNNMTRSNILWF